MDHFHTFSFLGSPRFRIRTHASLEPFWNSPPGFSPPIFFFFRFFFLVPPPLAYNFSVDETALRSTPSFQCSFSPEVRTQRDPNATVETSSSSKYPQVPFAFPDFLPPLPSAIHKALAKALTVQFRFLSLSLSFPVFPLFLKSSRRCVPRNPILPRPPVYFVFLPIVSRLPKAIDFLQQAR